MFLVPGMRIGAYTVRGFLGNGSGSFVYEVETELGGRYALKMSRVVTGESASLAWEMDQRFTRNIVCLEQLQDVRWVAKIIAHDRYPDPKLGQQYLVQELVPAPPGLRRPESIVAWARRTSPSIRKLVTVFMQLAEACEEMREAGIQNRDLKPANILMTPDGEPRLIDFNSAIWHRAALLTWPSARYIPTSPAYMPPEMAKVRLREKETGREEPFLWTPAADLHALGVVFYKLLTGEHPFDLSPKELLTQIAYVQPMRPMDLQPVPFGLSKVVMRLLAKDPEERYQEGGELRDDLEALSRIADASWDVPYEVPRTDRHDQLPEPDTREVDTAEPREPVSSLPSPREETPPPVAAIVPVEPLLPPVRLVTSRPDRHWSRVSAVAALLLAGIGAGLGWWAGLSPGSPPVEELATSASEPSPPPVNKTLYRARGVAPTRTAAVLTGRANPTVRIEPEDDEQWLASCQSPAREAVGEGSTFVRLHEGPNVILHDDGYEVKTGLVEVDADDGRLTGKVIAAGDRVHFRFTGFRPSNGPSHSICGIAADGLSDHLQGVAANPSELHPGYLRLPPEPLRIRLASDAPRGAQVLARTAPTLGSRPSCDDPPCPE